MNIVDSRFRHISGDFKTHLTSETLAKRHVPFERSRRELYFWRESFLEDFVNILNPIFLVKFLEN